MTKQLAVRPRKRRVELALRAAILGAVAFAFIYNQYFPAAPNWAFWLCVAPFLWPVVEKVRERREKLAVEGGKVVWERGGGVAWEAGVGKLEEVEYRQRGWGRLVGWGQLHVKAAGAEGVVIRGGRELEEFGMELRAMSRQGGGGVTLAVGATAKSKKQERSKKK